MVLSGGTQYILIVPAAVHIAVLFGIGSGATVTLIVIGIALFIAFGGDAALGMPLLFPSPKLAIATFLIVPFVLTILPIYLYMSAQARVIRRLDAELAMRTLAESELRVLNERLEIAVGERTAELREANSELNTFAQRVAHDLRGAIGHVSGFMGLVVARPSVQADEKATAYAQRAEQAGVRLADLVDSLLALATINTKPLGWQALDLDKMVAEVVDGVSLVSPERKIEWDIRPLGACSGDRALIANVLHNLVGNAVKFTGIRDVARISVVPEGGQEDDHWLRIRIRDNGAGFDMARASRLFGGLQRLHASSQFEGHGLGLASCKNIIDMHGGEISTFSVVDEGATFWITLPRSQPLQTNSDAHVHAG